MEFLDWFKPVVVKGIQLYAPTGFTSRGDISFRGMSGVARGS